jgi:hypothetical protein
MVLLMDFDGRADRMGEARNSIPDRMIDRVFVLGAWTEPEALRALGSYETIGRALAEACGKEAKQFGNHALLRHNSGEVARLRTGPSLFPSR